MRFRWCVVAPSYFALLGGAVASCLDVQGVVVQAVAPRTDSQECEKCFSASDDPGPGCANELAACDTSPKCGAALKCAVASGCFVLSQELSISCGTACISDAGVTSVNEESTSLLYALWACVNTQCKNHCFGASQDASAAADAAISNEGSPEASRACLTPGDKSNEKGYGAYCENSSECDQTAGLRVCGVDYGGGPFCTGLCVTDDDCGSGAVCVTSDLGKGCVPVACAPNAHADGGH